MIKNKKAQGSGLMNFIIILVVGGIVLLATNGA